jgi:fermentation-respiration switch protein FrsA (DUF1100 family)
MMTALRMAAVFFAVVYAGITLYMYLQQRSLQYHPSNRGLTPEGEGLSGVTVEKIATPDGETIVAWFAEARDGNPTILFFHGNGGEIGGRADRLAYYQSQGFGALFVSYRGYGASSGSISEAGLITDGLSAYDFLIGHGIPAGKIAVVGESLGTGVAVQLAAQRSVGALALEAPYTATVDVGAEIYWWLPVRLLMKDTFKSRDFIGKVKVPLLVQHGDVDTLIPVEHGRRLFEMANEPKELIVIPGGDHGVIQEERIWRRELDFFRQNIPVQ